MENAPTFGTRFASGDRSYSDLSLWWYFAQTDWSGGIKDDRAWIDDAKFYYSTNIDVSQPGAIKLAKSIEAFGTVPQTAYCGGQFSVRRDAGTSTTTSYFIGTADKSSDSKPRIYEWDGDSWEEFLTGSDIGTNQNIISQVSGHKSTFWASTVGNGNTGVVLQYSGTAWIDHSAAIITAVSETGGMGSSRCHCEVNNVLYVEGDDFLNDHVFIVSTADNGTTWTKVAYHNTDGLMVDMCGYDGDLYYLISDTYTVKLWKYDIASAAKTMLYEFKGTYTDNGGVGGKLLQNKFGKLVITIPSNEIWTWDGSNIERIYKADEKKTSIGYEASAYLTKGAVIVGDLIYWGNLIYDGEDFYNYTKPIDDATDQRLYPVFVDNSNKVIWLSSGSTTALYKDLTTYRTGADKNFLVFSEMEEVSTIDKLNNSVRIVFKPFVSGDSIKVYYSINGGTSYTELGTASYALDGGSRTDKIFYMGDAVTSKKIMFKVYLNSSGTTTPELYDLSLQYIPIPDPKFQWNFNLRATDEMKLLDEQTSSPLTGLGIRNKLRAALFNRTVVPLEDVDYNETLLNGSLTSSATTITVDSTDGFAESDRIKIDNEEILYTGKTATTFTGCTRGARGTQAVSHSDNAVASNQYKVLIIDMAETTPVANDFKATESILQVKLIEV